MNQRVAEPVADVLKAVAHPMRLRIIEVLEGGEKGVGDIVGATGGKQAIASQHLNMMRDKEVLACRREGAKVYYGIEDSTVIRLLHCIHDHCEQK